MSPQEKFDLFEELLDKLTILAKSLSQEDSTIAQLIINCQNKVSKLKPLEQNFSEEPQRFTEEYMLEQINFFSNHLTDLFKMHEERFANIESIPKSILIGLEKDQKRLWKIYDWIVKEDLLSPVEKRISILNLLKDQFGRTHQLIKAWSGKDDQNALNRMSTCNDMIMHLSCRKAPNPPGSTFTAPIPSQIPTVQPKKPTPATNKIQPIFKTAILGLFFFGISVFLYRRFTRR